MLKTKVVVAFLALLGAFGAAGCTVVNTNPDRGTEFEVDEVELDD